MLNPPIENEWKNDAIRKIDKCIFKTISGSLKEKKKKNDKKEYYLHKVLKVKTKERYKENKKFLPKAKETIPLSIKNDNKKNLMPNHYLYELLSANRDCILLKRKKLRDERETRSFKSEYPLRNTEKIKKKSISDNRVKNILIGKEENILDFDRILDEVLEEKQITQKISFENSSSISPSANLHKTNKIKIETKALMKGNLINKLRKKDQDKIKPITKKALSFNEKEKSVNIENENVIKIPNFEADFMIQKNNIKEKTKRDEILKLKKLEEKKMLLENSNTVIKKIVKSFRGKLKKMKKRSQKRDSSLYDINNFVVQNNTNKINERKEFFNIPIPVFKELDEDFYNFNQENCEEIKADNCIEETIDEAYLKFHDVYEKREFEFRINFFKKKNQRQKSENITNQENSSIQESNTIDSVIRINCNFLQEDGFLVK